MDKKWIIAAFIAIFALSSCLEKEVYQGPEEDEKEFNDFDFSTVQSATSLEVSYANSGVKANVYFEVYDEIPVEQDEYTYTKKTNVTPLFAAYTADNSVYKGTIDLPAYLQKVYIYTPAFFAQTLIEADVTNGSIQASDSAPAKEAETRTTPTLREYDSYMATSFRETPGKYQGNRWKTWLGEYNRRRNGEIDYQYQGDLAATWRDGLYTIHSQVINVNKDCPEELKCYSDISIDKDAEIALTFLGQNTCWNCSMGYYYYKATETPPASLEDADVIMLFPNTQDGYWINNPSAARRTAGVDRLTAVKLMYYPHIADGSREDATTVFPAGYKVGLVIANNAWSNRVSGFDDDKRYRAATSQGLSVDNSGNAFDAPRTAAYSYNGFVMVSFEDHINDNNFSDIVVALKSNPVGAIEVDPDVDPDNNRTTTEILKGIYAFEDLWPNKGDYDMNDVIVRYNYEKTFDKDNQIYAESFIFKTFQNYAGNTNGLAFQLVGSGNASSVTGFIRRPGETEFSETDFVYEEDDRVYILTEDVKENMGTEYKVTLKYDSPTGAASEARPFIFKNEADGKRWEVHIPKEHPTSKMDMSYFQIRDDASNPEQNIYYVRPGNYPFAFFLSGANETDISKLLDIKNEKTPIDQLYSGYSGWVTSNGKENQDWYKK